MNELLFHSMTDEIQKHCIESKKSDTKDCILHDIIYGKFKNVQHYMVIEVTVAFGEGE